MLPSLPMGSGRSTLYLEEIRSGWRRLAAVSMRRYPPTMNTDRILSTLDPNAQSDRRAALTLVQVPDGVQALDATNSEPRQRMRSTLFSGFLVHFHLPEWLPRGCVGSTFVGWLAYLHPIFTQINRDLTVL